MTNAEVSDSQHSGTESCPPIERQGFSSDARQLLATTLGKIVAGVSVLSILFGAVNGGANVYRLLASGKAHSPVSVADLNEPLSLSETPSPGSQSSQLGFGDSIGGRPTYDYTAGGLKGLNNPTLDSIVDLSHVGDERQFVRAQVTDHPSQFTEPFSDMQREVHLLSAASFLQTEVYLDNDALPQADCNILTGNTVATGVYLRAAIWRSASGSDDIVRIWVSSMNSTPSWITDAILVHTPAGTTLQLVPASGFLYRMQPASTSTPGTISANVLAAGGSILGNGSLGACWSNLEVVDITFRLS